MLDTLLKCTVEKYIILTILKGIILSSSENSWCQLCLCEVALLLLHMCRCKAKQILLSTVGFLAIIQVSKMNSTFYLSFHVLNTSVPIRWSDDWDQTGCNVCTVSCHQKSPQVLLLGKSSSFENAAWKGTSCSLTVVLCSAQFLSFIMVVLNMGLSYFL